jgi:hypothetical protein
MRRAYRPDEWPSTENHCQGSKVSTESCEVNRLCTDFLEHV